MDRRRGAAYEPAFYSDVIARLAVNPSIDPQAFGRMKLAGDPNTILREAEVSMVDIIERRGKEAFLDSLFVMEEGMRHYFSKAMQAKTNNMKPEIVDNYMQKAIDVAEKVAPYRHARLSAVKLAGDPNNSAPFKDGASVDELREEIMQPRAGATRAGGSAAPYKGAVSVRRSSRP